MFEVHMLNEIGIERARALQDTFEETLKEIESVVSAAHGHREMAIVRTKLQEASFFAKRAMALDPANQKGEQ